MDATSLSHAPNLQGSPGEMRYAHDARTPVASVRCPRMAAHRHGCPPPVGQSMHTAARNLGRVGCDLGCESPDLTAQCTWPWVTQHTWQRAGVQEWNKSAEQCLGFSSLKYSKIQTFRKSGRSTPRDNKFTARFFFENDLQTVGLNGLESSKLLPSYINAK